MTLPTKTRQWILAKKPVDMPTDDTFKLVEKPIPELKDDQVLAKVLYLSNDPAQRGWIQAGADPERMYVPPVPEGTPMRARGIGQIIASKASKIPEGTLATLNTGWTEYGVFDAKDVVPIQKVGELSETQYLGAFGSTGLTAYYGLQRVDVTAEDTVVVSGAAGATGSMVVQIAKNIIGCKKVIGIAGSDDKCRWVESLGADLCINYKSPNFKSELRKATEGYVSVYFDNVGGKILDLMLTRLSRHGRVAACGAIANYNAGANPEPLKNWFEVISNRIKIQGFIIFDFADKFRETTQLLIQAYKDGKIKVSGESETVVEGGFEKVPETWLGLFSGGNQGKLVTKIVNTKANL